jgi:hypothetical protein
VPFSANRDPNLRQRIPFSSKQRTDKNESVDPQDMEYRVGRHGRGSAWTETEVKVRNLTPYQRVTRKN